MWLVWSPVPTKGISGETQENVPSSAAPRCHKLPTESSVSSMWKILSQVSVIVYLQTSKYLGALHRVPTGPGILEKSWNLEKNSRTWKSTEIWQKYPRSLKSPWIFILMYAQLIISSWVEATFSEDVWTCDFYTAAISLKLFQIITMFWIQDYTSFQK